jgi:hypothetical protein
MRKKAAAETEIPSEWIPYSVTLNLMTLALVKPADKSSGSKNL